LVCWNIIYFLFTKNLNILFAITLKLKTEQVYDPAKPLLGIFMKECKSVYNDDICTLRCIAALFGKNQPRCPPTDE
jgi:hypothetical protein